MFVLDAKRIATMRERLGEDASSMIEDKFLPMFRNRQKRFQAEFNESVKIARKKSNPGRYLATIWSNKNIEKSLEWLRGIINRARSKLIELKHSLEKKRLQRKFEKEFNSAGKAKLNSLINRHHILLKA